MCAGGRYDGLIGQVGGKSAPAVGWALGMERILELLKSAQLLPTQPAVDVFAVVPDASSGPLVARVLRQLRQQGIQVQMHAAGPDGQGSMKSQFKKADASQARFALIFGQDEVAGGMVALKPLRASPGETTAAPQRLCPLDDVNAWVNDLRA